MARLRTRGAREEGEAGFTVVESLVALVLVFLVMGGAVATLGAGSRALHATRERNGATQLAADELERARAAGYATLGHAAATDATLASDPAVTDAGGGPTYQGEALVDAGAGALLAQHTWHRTVDGVTYAVQVYVTTPPSSLCGACKRITAGASWGGGVYGTGGATSVTLSTIVAARS
jgi:type II secretory pathway pseudopilin PulG